MTKTPVLALLFTLGCATSREPSKPIVRFPTPADLAALEAKPSHLPSVESAAVPSEGWSVDPTLAVTTIGETWVPHGPWDDAFAATFSAANRKARLTRAMACVAGEIGRFYAQQQAAPPEALRRFVSAGCGVFAPAVGFQLLSGAVPDGFSEKDVLDHWRGQLPDLLGRLPADAREIGFAVSRHGGRVVAMAAYGSAPVTLNPFSLVPDSKGEIVIEGRFEGGDVGYFGGYANQGRFGVSSCLVDPARLRPQFRITCRIAADDETAWLQIVYAQPGRVLAMPLVQVLARRDPAKPLVYAADVSSALRPVTDAAAFAPAVLENLNAVRAEAGLKPVRLATLQSGAAGRVARQYFAAMLGNDASGDRDTIALGLLAGWQVGGLIRDGGFFSSIVPHTRDAGRWLSEALAMPMGRDTLLAGEVDEVAFGSALFSDPDGIGAIVTSYRLQHGNDHSADVDILHRRIAAARKSANLSVPVRLGLDGVLRNELGRVQQGTGAPFDALQASLERATQHFSVNMRGYVIEATSLDALEIPPELLRQSRLQLDIGVTHYKPPGAAWAQLVIVVVYVDAPLIKA